MEATVTTLKSSGCFIDQNCTIEIEGKKFESGGAFLGIDKNGKRGGILYGDWKDYKTISNWDGSISVPAKYYGFHKGNMGDKRCFVRFTYQGVHYFGRWFGIDNSQIVRVKEIK